MSDTEQYFDRYRELRKITDINLLRLSKIHDHKITCHPGCSSCCVNLSVFPVEFETIKEEMKKTGFDIATVIFDDKATCGFLKNDLCQIYRYRPIICRTHGMPISFLNDNNPDELFKEVSFCEFNFDSDDDDLEEDFEEGTVFGEENTLDIDDLNTAFFKINYDFCGDAKKRIPLKELCSK